MFRWFAGAGTNVRALAAVFDSAARAVSRVGSECEFATDAVAQRPIETAHSTESSDVRVIHFSLQSNHLHAIVEARDEHALGRAMKGLCVRIARALNGVLERAGRVFADRYHARPLRTPREVRYALAYTLSNAREHGVRVEGIDPCSSGAAFDGWRERGVRALAVLAIPALPEPPVAAARSWLLHRGWRRHGLIGIADAPGGKVQR